jgi:hypothetical protein
MTGKWTSSGERKIRRHACYGSQPWRYEVCADGCEIVAFVDSSARWETIAIVRSTSDVKARALGEFIVGLVNERHQGGDILQAAFNALDGVLRDGLTFSTEQDAEHVVDVLKRSGF